jgi:hypothetical protein
VVLGEGVALPVAEAAEVGGHDVGDAIGVAADGDVIGVGGGCVATVLERAGGREEQEEWEHAGESEVPGAEAGHRRTAIGPGMSSSTNGRIEQRVASAR